MELVQILGAGGVDLYTKENCNYLKNVSKNLYVSVHSVNLDEINPMRIVSNEDYSQFADKVFFPLGLLEGDISSGQKMLTQEFLGWADYDSDKSVISIDNSGLLEDKIQLTSEGNSLLRNAIREKDILEFVRGCRNIAAYRGHHFLLTPLEGRNSLSFVLRTDYLKGFHVYDLIKEKNITAQTAAKIIADVAAAVYDIHQKGVVHHDIKPENIIYTTASSGLGRAVLIDFGVSCVINKPSPFPRGVIAGTVSYMSPEQVNEMIIPETDTFALGLLAYSLFTGKKASFVSSRDHKNISIGEYLITLARYGGVEGDNYQFGYNQRSVIMDNLKNFSEQWCQQCLPSSLFDAIEVALDPDYKKRELAPLGNEALKLATGETHTEELPQILPEENKEINSSLTPKYDLISLSRMSGTTFIIPTELITIPQTTIHIPELAR